MKSEKSWEIPRILQKMQRNREKTDEIQQKSYETQLPVPTTQELDSACVGATASASAAANAAAASATANAAAATTHTRTHTHHTHILQDLLQCARGVHVVCTWYARGVHVVRSGFSAPRSEPAASLQRGADTGFEDMASIGGIMKVSGAIGSAEHLP